MLLAFVAIILIVIVSVPVVDPGGGGGGTHIWKGRGCSSEILNFTSKRHQSGLDRSLCRPLKETGLKYRQIKSTMDFRY